MQNIESEETQTAISYTRECSKKRKHISLFNIFIKLLLFIFQLVPKVSVKDIKSQGIDHMY